MTWWRDTIDAKWYQQFLQLPHFSFFSYIRPDSESVQKSKERFFSEGRLPEFSYANAYRFDVHKYIESLQQTKERIQTSGAPTTIKTLYLAKIKELKNRAYIIEALQERNDRSVHDASLNLFGAPLFNRKDLNIEAEQMKEQRYKSPERTVTREVLQEAVQQILQTYHFQQTVLSSTPSKTIRVLHNLRAGKTTVYIPERTITPSRAERLLIHEIEVHVLRRENSYKTNVALIIHGLDNYIRTEEGLALYYQKQLLDPAAQTPGFWDAFTVAHGMHDNFPELFERIFLLKREIESKKPTSLTEDQIKEFAWNRCLRVYRGIHHPTQDGCIYVRDHIYRSGLQEVEEHIKTDGEQFLPLLFSGRVGIHHIPLLKQLHIEQGETPRMISKDLFTKKDA